MKFEKFVKKAMPHAVTLNVGRNRWISYGNMFAKIPSWCGAMGVESKENELLLDILEASEWSNYDAELTRAYLESPDGKSKDIIREFSDGIGSVGITNEQFSLIEKYDMCVIATLNEYGDEEKDISALLIGKACDIEDFEPDAIILGI